MPHTTASQPPHPTVDNCVDNPVDNRVDNLYLINSTTAIPEKQWISTKL